MKVFGVTGWKNTGKTHLTERLVAEFTLQGLQVSTIKRTHHNLDLDRPGTDSFRHRSAGAQEVILASDDRWALMRETKGKKPADLDQLLARMAPVDLVLVEGFKTAGHPKIETYRTAIGKALIADSNPSIVAVAADKAPQTALPVMDLDDTRAIAGFITRSLGLDK